MHAGRWTADVEAAGNEVVVFLIGMRVNRPWRLARWWPMFTAMPRMLAYLQAHPEKGLLGYRQALLPAPLVVQYWRSFDDLAAFARNRDDPHLAAWRRFNREVAAGGDAGIWHETFRVPAGSVESLYANVPAAGLGAAYGLVPVRTGRHSAAARIGACQDDRPALPPYEAPGG